MDTRPSVNTELDAFLDRVTKEVSASRTKYPQADGLVAALSSEVGELATAVLRESKERITAEAAQVAAVVVRIALEGDPTLDVIRERDHPVQHSASCPLDQRTHFSKAEL